MPVKNPLIKEEISPYVKTQRWLENKSPLKREEEESIHEKSLAPTKLPTKKETWIDKSINKLKKAMRSPSDDGDSQAPKTTRIIRDTDPASTISREPTDSSLDENTIYKRKLRPRKPINYKAWLDGGDKYNKPYH